VGSTRPPAFFYGTRPDRRSPLVRAVLGSLLGTAEVAGARPGPALEVRRPRGGRGRRPVIEGKVRFIPTDPPDDPTIRPPVLHLPQTLFLQLPVSCSRTLASPM